MESELKYKLNRIEEDLSVCGRLFRLHPKIQMTKRYEKNSRNCNDT